MLLGDERNPGFREKAGRDYTEQIASISIAIIQYNLLGLVKRYES